MRARHDIWVAKNQLQGEAYASISLITMWVSNCGLKYEQYEYTSYITSRVIMLTFIVHEMRNCNGTSVVQLSTHTALLQRHICVVQLSTHCIIAITPSGPAIQVV